MAASCNRIIVTAVRCFVVLPLVVAVEMDGAGISLLLASEVPVDFQSYSMEWSSVGETIAWSIPYSMCSEAP